MKSITAILGIVCVAAAQAAPVSITQADACPEIRARIGAQTGLLPKPDTALLEQLGKHSECRFSAAEVYRARRATFKIGSVEFQVGCGA